MMEPDQCPAAALAEEIRLVIEAQEHFSRARADAIASGKSQSRYDPIESLSESILDVAMEHASVRRATSARGALFQLCVLAALVEDLEDCACAGDADGARKKRTEITRLLHSVVGFIEAQSEARIEDFHGDYFLPRSSDATTL
jgi:hypothetical protein